MFDVSFVELLILGVVALVVLGPEKLPAAARTLGALARKARQSWQSVRSEFERELATDELGRSIKRTAGELDVGARVRSAVDELRATIEQPATQAGAEMRAAAAEVRDAAGAARSALDPAAATPVDSDAGGTPFRPPPVAAAERAPHD